VTRLARPAGLAAALIAASCSGLLRPPEPKSVNSYRSDARDLETVRRVMVLPPGQVPGVRADLESIHRALLTELAKLQRFELVPLPQGAMEDADLHETLEHGRLSAQALVSLGTRYRLDAVLIGTVTGYRAYKPPHLGLRLQCVSVHTGAPVWAAEGHYDAADAATVEDLQHYTRSFLAPDDSLHGWELNVIAPSRFAAFVVHRLVATCRD
jgi:hypothetical protein